MNSDNHIAFICGDKRQIHLANLFISNNWHVYTYGISSNLLSKACIKCISLESILNHSNIIVFPFKYKKNTYYIKRIIGLPGETVQIDENGDIYIDGELLEEGYGREVINQGHIGIAAEPIKLGSDEYFVLGDNRNNSSDSRTTAVGNIKRSEIIGKAWVRIWPFSKMTVLKHQ